VGYFVDVVWIERGELFVECRLLWDAEGIVESKYLLLLCVRVLLLESFEFGRGRLLWWDAVLALASNCERSELAGRSNDVTDPSSVGSCKSPCVEGSISSWNPSCSDDARNTYRAACSGRS
jgi:hypothetical protein